MRYVKKGRPSAEIFPVNPLKEKVRAGSDGGQFSTSAEKKKDVVLQIPHAGDFRYGSSGGLSRIPLIPRIVVSRSPSETVQHKNPSTGLEKGTKSSAEWAKALAPISERVLIDDDARNGEFNDAVMSLKYRGDKLRMGRILCWDTRIFGENPLFVFG